MPLKLTIKELSKIVNMPPSTIRYYCNIGLFKPSGTLENGYRYFSIEKIEELRFISYLRHLDIPLERIDQHLKNRSINDYEHILKNQLESNEKKIEELLLSQSRLAHRLKSLEYIHNLPTLNTIHIETLKTRHILRLDLKTHNQYDYEVALLEFETRGNLPPSLIIGDQGFIVHLPNYQTRQSEEFIGMYMMSESSQLKSHVLYNTFPAGKWLTLYFKGNHSDALEYYETLMVYAKNQHLDLANYALERTLIDHYISNDENNYITEIQIPIL